jgi:hypothetical protein
MNRLTHATNPASSGFLLPHTWAVTNLLVSRLDEQQRRWFVALEAKRVGRGGETLLAQITGPGSPHDPSRAA